MAIELTSGARVDGRYELDVQLGEGAFGSVWRARDTRLSGRAVAVKFLKPEHLERADLVARFDSEADALALLHHPNVVGVVDRGTWEGQRYLVTEFVSGESLTSWIERHRAGTRVPALTEVLAVFDQVCAGLEAAHAVRSPGPIVHRDLKPDNVLLRTLTGGEISVKVLDFGIAQLGARQGTRTGMLMGTPMYMSPEQAMGQNSAVGPWTDVFALGVIFIEMLTLRPQIDPAEALWGTVLQSGSSLRSRIGELRADVPGTVWDVIAKCLRGRGADRWQDAGALRRAAQGAWGPGKSPAVDAALAATQAANVPTFVPSHGSSPSPSALSSGRGPAMAVGVAMHSSSASANVVTDSLAATPPASRGLITLLVIVVTLGIGGGVALFLALRSARARMAPGQTTGPQATGMPANVSAPRARSPGVEAVAAPRPASLCAPHGALHAIGTRANVGLPLSLTQVGGHLLLGWVVPSLYARGGDDSALVELSSDGTLLRWIDREQPSEARGLALAPNFMFRVHGLSAADGTVVERVDRWENLGDGRVRLTCGALSNDLLVASDPAHPEALAADYRAMFFCRSVPEARPFVIGLRGRVNGQGGLDDRALLIATTGASVERAHSLWPIPIAAARVMASPTPVAALRGEAPVGLAVAPVAGVGYAVAFRHRRELLFGWMTDALEMRGPLQRIETHSDDPGRPHVSFDGTRVAIVFADREAGSPSDVPAPYTLRLASTSPGEPMSAPRVLGAATTHQFAPWLEPLRAGGWLLVYSEGPLALPADGTDTQRVFLQPLDAALEPVGARVALSEGTSASDARIVTTGDGFVVAMMTGRGDARTVSTLSGSCGARPATTP